MSPETQGAAAIAERLENEAREVLQAAEEILWNADGINSLTPRQYTVLRAAGFNAAGLEGRHQLEAELGRVASVRRHMATAGTNAKFAAAEERLAAAIEQDRLLRPELESTIRGAEAKVKELAAELQGSRMAVEQMRQARENLQSTNLLPKFARDELAIAERCGCTELRAAIAQLDSRLALIDGVQKLAANDDNSLHYCRRIDEENKNNPSHHRLCEVQRGGDFAGGMETVTYKVIPAELERHKRDLLLEKPEVEDQIAKAKAELARVRESFSTCRQFYVAQLPD